MASSNQLIIHQPQWTDICLINIIIIVVLILIFPSSFSPSLATSLVVLFVKVTRGKWECMLKLVWTEGNLVIISFSQKIWMGGLAFKILHRFSWLIFLFKGLCWHSIVFSSRLHCCKLYSTPYVQHKQCYSVMQPQYCCQHSIAAYSQKIAMRFSHQLLQHVYYHHHH